MNPALLVKTAEFTYPVAAVKFKCEGNSTDPVYVKNKCPEFKLTKRTQHVTSFNVQLPVSPKSWSAETAIDVKRWMVKRLAVKASEVVLTRVNSEVSTHYTPNRLKM